MESAKDIQAEAREALEAAETGSAGLAQELKTPRGYDEAIGACVAVVVAALAIMWELETAWSLVMFSAAIAVTGIVGYRQVRRFRDQNGVWITGWRGGGETRWSIAMYVVGVEVAAVGAIVAATQRLWWLVGLASVAAGAVFVLTSRDWMRRYRKEQGAA